MTAAPAQASAGTFFSRPRRRQPMTADSTPPIRLETILIIDDEAQLADVLAQNLENNGYIVLRAANAKTGWELATSAFPT